MHQGTVRTHDRMVCGAQGVRRLVRCAWTSITASVLRSRGVSFVRSLDAKATHLTTPWLPRKRDHQPYLGHTSAPPASFGGSHLTAASGDSTPTRNTAVLVGRKPVWSA